MALKFYTPSKSAELARERMSVRSRLPPFRRRVLEKLELLGLPHYLFQVEVAAANETKTVAVAVEAVDGTVAVLEGGAAFSEESKVTPLPAVLTLEEARDRVRTEFRWNLIAQAIKRKKHFQIKKVEGGELFYYPYWAGYYRRRGKWEFELMDAGSGMVQSSTVRRAVLKALCLMNQ
jgi:hypothetical protein